MVKFTESWQAVDGTMIFRLSCGCSATVDPVDLLRAANMSRSAFADAFAGLAESHVCPKSAPRRLDAPAPALSAPE